MGLTHFPNGISSFGVPVMGSAGNIPFTTGTYFFVDSTTGNNANDGLDKDHPFADVDYAVGQCTANKGDVILVMPNHAETLTTGGAWTLDKEGIYLVGLGGGDNRPMVTVALSTGADIGVDSDSITISNFYFDLTGVDALTGLIDVNDNHCTIENCEFLVSDSGGQAEDAILGDANADNLKVLNCEFYAVTTCSQSAVHSAGTTNIEIANCWMDGYFGEGIMYCSAASTQLNVHHNFIRTLTTDSGPWNLGATSVASLGILAYNVLSVSSSDGRDKITTEGGQASHFENYVTPQDVYGESGILWPAAYGS